MRSLSPRLASELAELVYEIREPNALNVYDAGMSKGLSDRFDLDLGRSRVVGEMGGFLGFFEKTSGFALVGHGKQEYSGHHVVAVRGTKTGHDWLTNGDVGYSSSVSGSLVHSGFNETFESMKVGLSRLLTPKLRSGHVEGVHCVGHSLGGALASLTADWIKQHYRKPVKLYSFGAPRVGLDGFATKFSHSANAHYRCTHGADPVPNVPLWPFVHAPVSGLEYRLDNGAGISISAHGMDRLKNPGYRNTADTDDWDMLHQNSMNYLNQTVRLDYKRRNEATFSGYWAEKISAALITLLKDAGYYSAVLAQAAISSTMTFYDLLARTLEQIAEASVSLADQTRGLLGHMLAFAKATVTAVIDMTFSFIRWVFDKTAGALYASVRQAIEQT